MGISQEIRDALITKLEEGLIVANGGPLRAIYYGFLNGPEQLGEWLQRFQAQMPCGVLSVPDVTYGPFDSPNNGHTKTTERFRFAWADTNEKIDQFSGFSIGTNDIQQRVVTMETVKDYIETTFNHWKPDLSQSNAVSAVAGPVKVVSLRGIDSPEFAAFVFEFDLDVYCSYRVR